MHYRIFFVLVAAFFVTMNVLLWRSEFTGNGRLGTPVPAELVWEKVLTSPDNSMLEIRHHGVSIGRAHWAASVGEEKARLLTEEQLPPEGMVRNLSGYNLDFDGNVSMSDSGRLRFAVTLKLDTNHNWQELNLKLGMRPYSWELEASAREERVRFVSVDDEGRREQRYRFAELRDPEPLLRRSGIPGISALLSMAAGPLGQASPARVSVGIQWQAYLDRLQIGRNYARVYRLEARLFDRYKAVVFVSPVGEILRVELPDDVVMLNDALINL